MSELSRTIAAHKRALAQRERQSRAVMRRAYAQALRALSGDLRAMQQRIAEIQASGENVPAWRLIEEARIRQLIAKTQIEMQRFSDIARADIIQRQRDAIIQAQTDARHAIESAFGPAASQIQTNIASIPTEAISQMVAVTQPTAPVGRLLNEMAGQSAQAVADEITSGMAAGLSPRVVAANIRRRLGGQGNRALLISRTEMLRAYRNSTLSVYDANKHLLKGWRWSSAQDSRTCPVCWAMDGKLFPTDVKMATHPGCRCSLSPAPKSFKELGIDVGQEPDFTPQSGPDAFADLPAAQQSAILGPSAYTAYRDGEIDLPNLVGITRSAVWGTGRRRISLDEAKRRAKGAA